MKEYRRPVIVILSFCDRTFLVLDKENQDP